MRRSFQKGFVTPQPVFIVGTYDEDGRPNAMNAAWAGQVGANQISMSLSPHQTTANLKRQMAFTVSFATQEQVTAADYVGIVSQTKVAEKMERAGFITVPSQLVHAPIIEQLPVALECRVILIAEEFDETRVVGEIVGMSADETVLTDDKVDFDKLNPIMFDSLGLCYRTIGERIGGAWSEGKKLM